MKKTAFIIIILMVNNFITYSQTITLSNFGVTELNIRDSKIAIRAKKVKLNETEINLSNAIVTRKIEGTGIRYLFSTLSDLTIIINPKEGIKVLDGKKTIIINDNVSPSLSQVSSVYLLLALKIEQQLNVGLKEVKEKIIRIKPQIVGTEMIVVGCFGFGGTATASAARSKNCIKSAAYKMCTFLGLDTSCVIDNLVCVSVATFDCP